MRQKSPMHPDAVPEDEQEQHRQHPVRVVMRGRLDVGGAWLAAFGQYCLQLGTGLTFEQGGDVQAELVAPPREQVRDVPGGEYGDPQIKEVRRGQGRPLFAVVDYPPKAGDAVGAHPQAQPAPAQGRAAWGDGCGPPCGWEGAWWRCHIPEVRLVPQKAKAPLWHVVVLSPQRNKNTAFFSSFPIGGIHG